ncbi:PadR family transcriptional regulator [Nocardia amikacinitolerans]|uniref:PadR family transcriptional regulator n=1 Tax=Nocardia amikacinitolerans TaxID=756689 RepID=UPI000833079B|nr:PadR family transcriptional regulator [Nocardia amikacinitolerans]MCP2281055.1 DNA-binding transcriptional regulator, PadR family [Nocardia amikacinitolerans]MCP2300078.1 DNA-binding transcriptional regulator, PadR family [Nocardia amikacinitolerans]MCP2320216.1 DNA-binding transcriptional regulator, PadR family [Nocardia amikacinitolerans]
MTNGGEPRETLPQLSDLEVALLGLLSVRPMTGYEIGKHYARALSPWWETPRTQIYPKLRELERRGLIAKETVVQDGKPNKQVYSIAVAGTSTLTEHLSEPIRGADMKHHMMMRLFLGDLLPGETMRRLLEDYRAHMAERAESLREARAKFSASLSGPHQRSVFFELLSLDHLIAIADLEVSGTEKVLEAIEHAPRADSRPGDVASPLLDAVRDRSD